MTPLVTPPLSEEDVNEYPLSDCISCLVTEKLNTSYELTLTYPLNGANFAHVKEKSMIKAYPNIADGYQPFYVYYVSRPINGIVTVKAEHQAYMGGNVICRGMTQLCKGNTASNIISYLNTETQLSPLVTGAVYSTDISSSIEADFDYKQPIQARRVIADAAALFGGQWKFNANLAQLKARRGQDRGFTVEYGVNARSLTTERDITVQYTHICPYWVGDAVISTGGSETMERKNVFMTNPYYALSNETQWHFKPYMLDCTSLFPNVPTEQELSNAAAAFAIDPSNKELLNGKDLNINLDFAVLKKTLEYINDSSYPASNDAVEIGDTVYVTSRYGENYETVCVSATFDSLREIYTAIELAPAASLQRRTRSVTKAPLITPANKSTAYTIAELQRQVTEKAEQPPVPDRVEKVSDNEVFALYGNKKETWKADGTGNERHNFRKIITEVTP